MGSKRRLLPWIFEVLRGIDFDTALDPFSGSGCVAYLMKCMGKKVIASDFLNFSATLATATIENNHTRLETSDVQDLLMPAPDAEDFIRRTFSGIFYTIEDLSFLDRVCFNIERINSPAKQALAPLGLDKSVC